MQKGTLPEAVDSGAVDLVWSECRDGQEKSTEARQSFEFRPQEYNLRKSFGVNIREPAPFLLALTLNLTAMFYCGKACKRYFSNADNCSTLVRQQQPRQALNAGKTPCGLTFGTFEGSSCLGDRLVVVLFGEPSCDVETDDAGSTDNTSNAMSANDSRSGASLVS